MGDHKSEGLSWADQWDPEPLPAPGEKKGAHKDAGKGTAAKKFLTFQWDGENASELSVLSIHKGLRM
nr:hypothetical protein DM860_007016 [Ipomoea trifida]